ncbi:hypothetical protein [Pseudomonas sp. Marseille-Q5115]|uniref:hypothetical protein n=1 Tax=Pseudomonas sp. Marseille-Q5115 TaxID=2866593 RepID=UPI001CE46DDC|nr:hypothetical protein [Pseudomonas sp. Marseille-Q5115]
MSPTLSASRLDPRAVRVVVDITGGVIHSVQCSQPVLIVFTSSHKDDVDDEFQQEAGYTDIHGKPVALVMDGSDGDESEGETVHHYFEQWLGAHQRPSETSTDGGRNDE